MMNAAYQRESVVFNNLQDGQNIKETIFLNVQLGILRKIRKI